MNIEFNQTQRPITRIDTINNAIRELRNRTLKSCNLSYSERGVFVICNKFNFQSKIVTSNIADISLAMPIRKPALMESLKYYRNTLDLKVFQVEGHSGLKTLWDEVVDETLNVEKIDCVSMIYGQKIETMAYA